MSDRDQPVPPPGERAARPTRRAFLGSMAIAPAAFASPPAAPSTPAPSETEAAAEALAEVVRRRFGAHLDAAELQAVRKEIARGIEAADRMRRAFRLGNAVEPVNRFEARPPEPPPRGSRS
ncbi:MAG: hypothetical protein A2V74_01015 [Acidobacteria bacterium RBG_16_70_10]|nr:MAG: hypothetical protein A2V74_01015 [Acidobacteria bacterium RBG_16_70_10]